MICQKCNDNWKRCWHSADRWLECFDDKYLDSQSLTCVGCSLPNWNKCISNYDKPFWIEWSTGFYRELSSHNWVSWESSISGCYSWINTFITKDTIALTWTECKSGYGIVPFNVKELLIFIGKLFKVSMSKMIEVPKFMIF